MIHGWHTTNQWQNNTQTSLHINVTPPSSILICSHSYLHNLLYHVSCSNYEIHPLGQLKELSLIWLGPLQYDCWHFATHAPGCACMVPISTFKRNIKTKLFDIPIVNVNTLPGLCHWFVCDIRCYSIEVFWLIDWLTDWRVNKHWLVAWRTGNVLCRIYKARAHLVYLTNVARSARWLPSRSAWANRSACRQL